MTFTSRRHALYTREQLDAARAAWTAGEFSDEWRPWRHMAAMEAGIIVPPKGTKWDQWDDERPSERAQIVRAMRETPRALEAAIKAPNVRSWAAVIAQLVRRRETVTDDVDHSERQWATTKRVEPRQATYRLAEIIDTIAGSR